MKVSSAVRIPAIALVAILALHFAVGSTIAQQIDLEAIHKRALELLAGGDYATALTEARKLESAVRADSGTSSSDYGVALTTIGLVYQAQAKYREAEEYTERALAVLERTLGPNDSGLAPTLNNLATMYVLRGKYVDAERLLKRALAINERAFGANHPNVASVLENLANVYLKQGNQPQAMRLLERARAIELETSKR
jgi:tetratricopeptide (TPR) repeat protein